MNAAVSAPNLVKSTRIKWKPLLLHARDILNEYDTSVTLRQLFYQLVADGSLPNLQSKYTALSSNSAKARRAGWFPELLDRTSRIERYLSFSGPNDAMRHLRDTYRRDRTERQEWTIILGVEKAGMSAQLDNWFTNPLGIPHVALGGYASQTLCTQVTAYVQERDRPAVLIYAGDLDPTGEDIDRDFEKRVGAFDKVVRVALNEQQVAEYELVENSEPEVIEKLERDTRGAAFVERHGSLTQYEVDALTPGTLRDLYGTALQDFWDDDAYQDVLEGEEGDRAQLDWDVYDS